MALSISWNPFRPFVRYRAFWRRLNSLLKLTFSPLEGGHREQLEHLLLQVPVAKLPKHASTFLRSDERHLNPAFRAPRNAESSYPLGRLTFLVPNEAAALGCAGRFQLVIPLPLL